MECNPHERFLASQEGEHFLSFDLRWSGVEDILQDLRSSSSAVAEACRPSEIVEGEASTRS